MLFPKIITICFVALFGTTLPLFAQNQPKKTSIPEEAQKRLDHMIGKWHIKTDYLNPNGEVRRTVEGTEEAKYIIDKRVVELTTTVQNSYSKGWVFYNINEQKFYLTSVDGNGDLWILSGGLDAYIITSQPKKQPNGREITIRFTHSNIQEDSFEAVMESSIDGGQTWWTRYRQYLTRQKE
ncbi:MAG: hypothetical protein QGG64_29090 [Candidatus Latescibacteria bacterium]|jgi:hypothetical protein|nr:hypothetical protein [Candidatus Latescibacterota bacterium]